MTPSQILYGVTEAQLADMYGNFEQEAREALMSLSAIRAELKRRRRTHICGETFEVVISNQPYTVTDGGYQSIHHQTVFKVNHI